MAQAGQSSAQGNGVTIQRTRTDAPPPLGFLQTLGRKSWPLLHGISDRWPCRRCRPSFAIWMSGLHDVVNVRIGKNPHRPEAFERFQSGALEGPFHPRCIVCRAARWVSRIIAQVPKSRKFL